MTPSSQNIRLQAERRKQAWFEQRLGTGDSAAGNTVRRAAGSLPPYTTCTSAAPASRQYSSMTQSIDGGFPCYTAAANAAQSGEQACAQHRACSPDGAAMEAFLAKEIESHTCPVCYELMLAPTHAPCLLFPCGHTFCASCLQRTAGRASATQADRAHARVSVCPFCREPIERQAANVALQQLIQSYASQRDARAAIFMATEAQGDAAQGRPAAEEAASTEEDRCAVVFAAADAITVSIHSRAAAATAAAAAVKSVADGCVQVGGAHHGF